MTLDNMTLFNKINKEESWLPSGRVARTGWLATNTTNDKISIVRVTKVDNASVILTILQQVGQKKKEIASIEINIDQLNDLLNAAGLSGIEGFNGHN